MHSGPAEGGGGGSHSPLRRDSCSGGCHRTRPCWRRRGPACWGTRLPGWTRQRRPQKSPERPEEHCSALQGKLQNPHAALPAPTKSGLFLKSLRALDWGFRHIPRGRAGRAGENWMHTMPFQEGLHTTLVCRQCSLLPLSRLSSSQCVPSFSCCWSESLQHLGTGFFFLPGLIYRVRTIGADCRDTSQVAQSLNTSRDRATTMPPDFNQNKCELFPKSE